jgi:hypothetical protein
VGNCSYWRCTMESEESVGSFMVKVIMLISSTSSTVTYMLPLTQITCCRFRQNVA